jgi:importin-5
MLFGFSPRLLALSKSNMRIPYFPLSQKDSRIQMLR